MKSAFKLQKYFSIFIKTQTTPNPCFIKFFPGKDIMSEGATLDISNQKEALKSPLAIKIFDVKGINRVMYAKDSISVGKNDEEDWNVLKPMIIDVISDHFTKNLDLFVGDYKHEENEVLNSLLTCL